MNQLGCQVGPVKEWSGDESHDVSGGWQKEALSEVRLYTTSITK
jgi:hypothetical protein